MGHDQERETDLMREIAAKVREGLASGRRVRVGRVVAFRGFGGRRAGEALAIFDDGLTSGSLLGGIADASIDAHVTETTTSVLLELDVADNDAVAAGLACGGIATVLASDAAMMPAQLWAALENRWPVAVVTRPAEAAGPNVLALVDNPVSRSLEQYGSVGDAGTDEEASRAARQALRSGRDSTQIQLRGDAPMVVETYFPSTTLLVVGDGQLADALAVQGRLLGWSTDIVGAWNEEAAEQLRTFGRSDAIVVLSHDPKVDTPALAAALATDCYVGALGSRNTQARRRERLRREAHGLGDATLDRIHGPVGLDVGARTPEETAVAVAGEILAHRSGRSAASLRTSSGPING
jgi:xanthine dehydrogenase accessory factor